MQDKIDILNILDKQFHDNKLSHAFLVETDDADKTLNKILNFLKKINCEEEYIEDCSKCNLCHLILTKQLPSLIVIKPDGAFIKKEQILDLKNSFETKPLFSKYNMYIVMNCECLNSSSANAMLKFLEEPEDKIIGFFITNNKENVIDTIKSRCQILLDYYFDNNIIGEDIENEAINYIKQLESAKVETLLYNKDVILPKITDKNWLVQFFLELIKIYKSLYETKIKNESINERYKSLNFILKNDVLFFGKRLELLTDLLTSLDFNVNNQMVLDRLVLESW